IIDIACGRAAPLFGVPASKLAKQRFVGIEMHRGEYYVRLKVQDKPGVLASITALFSKGDISVDKVLQKADPRGQTAQPALTAHGKTERAIGKALAAIGRQSYVLEPPHMIRIERF